MDLITLALAKKYADKKQSEMLVGEWTTYFGGMAGEYMPPIFVTEKKGIPTKAKIKEVACVINTENWVLRIAEEQDVDITTLPNNKLSFSVTFTKERFEDDEGKPAYRDINETKTFIASYEYREGEEVESLGGEDGYFLGFSDDIEDYTMSFYVVSAPIYEAERIEWEHFSEDGYGLSDIQLDTKNSYYPQSGKEFFVKGKIDFINFSKPEDDKDYIVTYHFFQNNFNEITFENGIKISITSITAKTNEVHIEIVESKGYGINHLDMSVGKVKQGKINSLLVDLEKQIDKNENKLFDLEKDISQNKENGGGGSSGGETFDGVYDLVSEWFDLIPDTDYGITANFEFYQKNLYFEQPTKILIKDGYGSIKEYNWGERVFTENPDWYESLEDYEESELLYEYGEYTYANDRKVGNYVKFWTEKSGCITIEPGLDSGISVLTVRKESLSKRINDLTDIVSTKASKEDTLVNLYDWIDYEVSTEFPYSAMPFYCRANGIPTHVKGNVVVADFETYNDEIGDFDVKYEFEFEQKGFKDIPLPNGMTLAFIQFDSTDGGEIIWDQGIAMYIKGEDEISVDPGTMANPEFISGWGNQYWCGGTVSFYEPIKIPVKNHIRTLDSKVKILEDSQETWYDVKSPSYFLPLYGMDYSMLVDENSLKTPEQICFKRVTLNSCADLIVNGEAINRGDYNLEVYNFVNSLVNASDVNLELPDGTFIKHKEFTNTLFATFTYQNKIITNIPFTITFAYGDLKRDGSTYLGIKAYYIEYIDENINLTGNEAGGHPDCNLSLLIK